MDFLVKIRFARVTSIRWCFGTFKTLFRKADLKKKKFKKAVRWISMENGLKK